MPNLLPNGSERVWSPSALIIKHPVRICGVASTGAPVLGITYIAELLEPIPGYDYTHVPVFELHLDSE